MFTTQQQQQQLTGAEVDAFLLNAFGYDVEVESTVDDVDTLILDLFSDIDSVPEQVPEPEVLYTDDDLRTLVDNDVTQLFTDESIAARNDFKPAVFQPNDNLTPHRGRYTQQDAVSTGHSYLLYTLENGQRRFHAFETHKQRQIATATWISRGVEVHERCIGTNLTKPFLDIDGSLDLTDNELLRIACTFVYVLMDTRIGMSQIMEWDMNRSDREVSVDTFIANFEKDVKDRAADPRSEVAVWGYTSNTKRSMHIVAQQVVTTGANIKAIAQRVKNMLPEGPMRDSVDVIGGDLSFGLRLPNCGKAGDMSRKLEFKFATTVDDHVPSPWLHDDTCVDSRRNGR